MRTIALTLALAGGLLWEFRVSPACAQVFQCDGMWTNVPCEKRSEAVGVVGSPRAQMNLDRGTPFFSSGQRTSKDQGRTTLKQSPSIPQTVAPFEGTPEKRYALWRLAELEGKYDQLSNLYLQEAISTVRKLCQDRKGSDEGCLEALHALLTQPTGESDKEL